MARKKILWLCSWYPNRLEPFNGDFIQRHARAASLSNDIHVVHLVADPGGWESGKEELMNTGEGLTEQILYYKKKDSAWGRFRAHYRWLYLYKQALRNYIVKNGKPDLVHVQVPMKAGILAVWLQRRYKVPFLVTEHWGIYNEVAEDRFALRSKLFRHYTKQVFEKAVSFISVSRFLAEGVNRLVLKKDYQVIPNVVSTDLFFYKESEQVPFRFIHVSNMVPLKNAEGIIRAFAALYRQDQHAELLMVGDTEPGIRNFAASMGLPEKVIRFRGEVPYGQVAKEMQEAGCLVLFSNIENSPCVIGEGLCCGLPVIATDVGGIPELVDASNSLLVKAGDEQQLTVALQKMIRDHRNYNPKEIAAKAAARFSYETVGRLFDSVYDSLISSQKISPSVY